VVHDQGQGHDGEQADKAAHRQASDAGASAPKPQDAAQRGDGSANGSDHGAHGSNRDEGPSPRTVNRAIVAGSVFTAAGFVLTLVELFHR
jgi:hypothetical protein